MSRKTIIAGNWKMHGSQVENAILVDGIISSMSDISAEIVICPPSIYISQIANITTNKQIKIGAQNLNANQSGAFTGELSGAMLRDFEVDYVIVGHSERRNLYNETNKIVANKVKIAIASGLTPILCIGEELGDRENNKTNFVLEKQIQTVLRAVGISAFTNIVIAYEPVWAIGTGITATPKQAQQAHSFVRSILANLDSDIAENISILYGGSMNPSNAKELLSCQDIDGGLIGGASLKAEDFLTICRSI